VNKRIADKFSTPTRKKSRAGVKRRGRPPTKGRVPERSRSRLARGQQSADGGKVGGRAPSAAKPADQNDQRQAYSTPHSVRRQVDHDVGCTARRGAAEWNCSKGSEGSGAKLAATSRNGRAAQQPPRSKLHITRRTDRSYVCRQPEALCQWLLGLGYRRKPLTSPYELARLRNKANGLIIIYYTGAVVVGGPAHGARLAFALLDKQRQEIK
jgi:hypothetical protein